MISKGDHIFFQGRPWPQEQFNPHNGTYNLDVRPEADADKDTRWHGRQLDYYLDLFSGSTVVS